MEFKLSVKTLGKKLLRKLNSEKKFSNFFQSWFEGSKISICRINSEGAPKKTNSDNQSTINQSIAVVVLFLYISSYVARLPDYFLPSTTLCMPKLPETGLL